MGFFSKEEIEFEDDSFEEDTDYIGEFSEGDIVSINSEDYEILKFIKIKEVEDSNGFISLYSWYSAKGPEGNKVNLFFFDSDIDSIEENDQVAELWFEEYGS